MSTSCDPCNFLYEEPPAPEAEPWKDTDPFPMPTRKASKPAPVAPDPPAAPPVSAPKPKPAPPLRAAPKYSTRQTQAEDAARQVIYSWAEHGRTADNDLSPDQFPTAEFSQIAEAVAWSAGEGIRGISNILSEAFTEAPEGIRSAFIECCEGVMPATPKHCGPLLERLRRFHVERRKREIADRIRRDIDHGDDIDGHLAELAALESAGTRKSRSMIVCGVNTYPTLVPKETVILGNGWVRRGDVITLVSGAGGGKSVAATQMAMAWALGLPYFGIRPPRALRILLFSGEDDGVTLGQCREGFLLHSEAITGKQITAKDLEPLDDMIRTEFIREHVGERFHEHLTVLLKQTPADLVIINPLLSYIGGEIVAKASEWLRAGLMPVLQKNDCAALVIHHTPKLSKDSWDTIDDTYSAIGGGEIANIPRSVLTLKPTPADGLFVVTVSKRQTTGWKDGEGKFTTSFFVRRSGDPERPAWLPVDHDEAQDMIGACRPSRGAAAGSGRKATTEHVVEALSTGAMQRVALIDWLMKNCRCSDKPARTAIRDAAMARLIVETLEPNPIGGASVKWFTLTEHLDRQVE